MKVQKITIPLDACYIFAISLVAALMFSASASADSVSITLDNSSVTLVRSGSILKSTSSINVKNSNSYGFSLSLYASNSDLVNTKDSTHKISATSTSSLGANQWGYGVGNDVSSFSKVPSGSSNAAVLADVTSSNGVCSDVSNCTKYVTYGANVDEQKIASGSYSTTVVYTAISKPAPYVPPSPPSPPYVPPSPGGGGSGGGYYSKSYCRSGYSSSDCKVNLGSNMFAVRYNDNTKKWSTIFDPDNSYRWYDYGDKKWANAVTFKPSAASKYNPTSSDRQQYSGYNIDINDVEAFWVYIPRYGKSSYDIKFYKSGDYASYSYDIPDAFTKNGEIDGFWVGKFELGFDSDYGYISNGSAVILPDKYPVPFSATNVYTAGKSTLGGLITFDGGYKLNGRVATNDEWNAIVDLAYNDDYGAGKYSIKPNFNGYCKDVMFMYGSYKSGKACSLTGHGRDGTSTYDTYTGNESSTTGNIYGVYDMLGGALEALIGTPYETNSSWYLRGGSAWDYDYIDKYSRFKDPKYDDSRTGFRVVLAE